VQLAKKILGVLSSVLLLVTGLSSPAVAAPSEAAYQAININSAWSKNILGQGVAIAMIDQGVNLQHEYFDGQVVDGFCMYQATVQAFCPNGTKSQTGIAAASQRRDTRGALFV
jgi:hypothetical protein